MRARVGTGHRAVFLDRDGTLNTQLAGYVLNPDELDVFPDAAEALRPFARRGIPLIIVSNQAGVGKGLMTEDDLQAIESRLREALGSSVSLAGAYYCRHTDEMQCACRKPRPGLVLMAAEEMGIDLAKSFLIGDSWRDMAAGRGAGVTTIFVPTGIDPDRERSLLEGRADYEAADLADAVRWICARIDDNQ